MSHHHKHDPNAPRPSDAADLLAKIYQVNDRPDPDGERPLKIWGTGLTYDEAWRLKEATNGSRKSTTARVAKMGTNGKVSSPVVAPKANGAAEHQGWTEAQRLASLSRAARENATQTLGVQAQADAHRAAQSISSQESPLEQLVAGTITMVAEAGAGHGQAVGAPPELSEAELQELLAGGESDADIDGLIDEAKH